MMAGKWKAVEKRYGKPMAELLDDLYQQYSKRLVVAQVLGVTQNTVAAWLVRCDLETVVMLRPVRKFNTIGVLPRKAQ